MKNKKILLIILGLLIIFVITIDIYLFKNSKKQNEFPNDITEIVYKKMWCYKEKEKFQNKENGIEYQLEENYSFFINENQQLISDMWKSILLFNSLSDLNNYYDYLINIIKYQPSLMSIDENKLMITLSLNALQGNYRYFNEEYRTFLKDSGYICSEAE